MKDHTERPSGEAPPPMPGSVELRLRGRPSDVDALIDVLSTCVPITVTPRRHYRDGDGKTVRRYVTVKPLYPADLGEDETPPATAFIEAARKAVVADAREFNTGALADRAEVMSHLQALRPEKPRLQLWATFELVAAAVKLADATPSDEGRAKARDRFLDDLTPGGGS